MANLNSYMPKAVKSNGSTRKIVLANSDPEVSVSDSRLSFSYPLKDEGSLTLTFVPGESRPVCIYDGPAPRGYKLNGQIMKDVELVQNPDGTRSDGHDKRLRFVY